MNIVKVLEIKRKRFLKERDRLQRIEKISRIKKWYTDLYKRGSNIIEFKSSVINSSWRKAAPNELFTLEIDNTPIGLYHVKDYFESKGFETQTNCRKQGGALLVSIPREDN